MDKHSGTGQASLSISDFFEAQDLAYAEGMKEYNDKYRHFFSHRIRNFFKRFKK